MKEEFKSEMESGVVKRITGFGHIGDGQSVLRNTLLNYIYLDNLTMLLIYYKKGEIKL